MSAVTMELRATGAACSLGSRTRGSSLSWDITADWQYDPALQTEIEVRFIAEGDAGTRVEFEHRRLDRYGDRRDEMRTIFDKTGDWGRFLAAFAETAAASARAG
jgi:hypothetical protein